MTQTDDYEDSQGNMEEDGTSSMEWLPEPRNEFENSCSNNFVNINNSELGNFDDELQKIYDEFNRDFEQSCFDYENGDSIDLTMGNLREKPTIKNPATCTGSM